MSQEPRQPVKLADDLRVSPHDDGATILDVREGQMFAANAVGARIMALLDEQRDLDAIVETLSTEFQASPEQVRADVEAFVAHLRSQKLVQG